MMKSDQCRWNRIFLILVLTISINVRTVTAATGAVLSQPPPATTNAAITTAAAGNAALSNVDWFASLDSNHDGTVDRKEFNQGLLKLESALHLPNAALTGAAGGSVITSTSSSSPIYSFFASLAHGSFWKGFTSSVAMIFATEIGDKTFFIAAVMSMRHDRSAVFCGAITALVIMTILSSAMGLILPQFLDRKYTHVLGGILFLYFGIKLLYESKQMEANRVSEELEEVEEELLHRKKDDKENPDIEAGNHPDEEQQQVQPSPASYNNNKTKKISAMIHKPNWLQICLSSLTLTFLAEWGDRSQIATIALAAAKNPYGVTAGGCLGHACCTGLAVMGGRMLAARISEKTVSFWGGVVFLLFGFHSMFFER
ncbi:Uncharacterized protein family UPF0016 [Fragilaria crotonensis]|nr:Uncharacterized protein family UPF0016 [Fragilaria crotonensis]